MSDSEDDTEKEHDPSQRRLDEARRKGDIPRSADLTVAASYAGLLLAGLVAGADMLRAVGEAGMVLLDQADSFAPSLLAAGRAPLGGMFAAFGMAIAPLFLAPMVAVLLTILAQRAFILSPEKLAFNWQRLSPLAAAKKKFGRDGLFEFGKSFVKMIIYSVILGFHLMSRAPEILGSLQLAPAMATGIMLKVLWEFLFLVLLVAAVMGGVDYFWQRAEHLRRNRMSRKDMMDEMKESDGDPHVKALRRQRGQEIATNRMLQDVAKADVVVVNPTHYAVALKWNRGARGAPVCVAKGVDEIAARIREHAAAAGVPIHRDPPTARAIHASVEIGAPIRPDHYRAVAAAIRFAEAMRKRSKRLRK